MSSSHLSLFHFFVFMVILEFNYRLFFLVIPRLNYKQIPNVQSRSTAGRARVSHLPHNRVDCLGVAWIPPLPSSQASPKTAPHFSVNEPIQVHY